MDRKVIQEGMVMSLEMHDAMFVCLFVYLFVCALRVLLACFDLLAFACLRCLCCLLAFTWSMPREGNSNGALRSCAGTAVLIHVPSPISGRVLESCLKRLSLKRL